MTLEELRKMVEAYSKRTDLRDHNFLDMIIELSAIKISRDVHMVEMERIASLNVVDKIGLPDGYVGMRSVRALGVRAETTLIAVSSDQFNMQHRMISVYMIKNGQIHIHGTADLTINYFVRPEKLVSNADTNFVLEAAPELYLYATLMQVWTSLLDVDAFENARLSYQGEVERVNINYGQQTFGSNKRIARIDW